MPLLTATSASALAASLSWRMLCSGVNSIFHKVGDSQIHLRELFTDYWRVLSISKEEKKRKVYNKCKLCLNALFIDSAPLRESIQVWSVPSSGFPRTHSLRLRVAFFRAPLWEALRFSYILWLSNKGITRSDSWRLSKDCQYLWQEIIIEK